MCHRKYMKSKLKSKQSMTSMYKCFHQRYLIHDEHFRVDMIAQYCYAVRETHIHVLTISMPMIQIRTEFYPLDSNAKTISPVSTRTRRTAYGS